MCVGDYANLRFLVQWVLIALADYLMMAESGVESRESGNYHGTANPNGQENPHQKGAIKGDGASSNRRIFKGSALSQFCCSKEG